MVLLVQYIPIQNFKGKFKVISVQCIPLALPNIDSRKANRCVVLKKNHRSIDRSIADSPPLPH